MTRDLPAAARRGAQGRAPRLRPTRASPTSCASLRPRIAVISVGAHNDYGHPRADTLAALRARRRAPDLPHRRGRPGRARVRRPHADGSHASVEYGRPMSERPSLKPVYLITGSDRPKVETAVQRLRARFLDEAAEIVTALETTGADAVNLCNAGSLFGDARLVLVNEVDGRRKEEGRPPTRRLEGRGRRGGRAPTCRRLRPTRCSRSSRLEVKKDAALAKACAKAGDLLVYDVPKRKHVALGRRPVPAGGRQGRARCVRTPDRVRRRGGSARSRERDRQDRDLGAGRAGRGRRGRAARRAGRRRAVVRAHRRLGRDASRASCSRSRETDARALRPAAARHRAAADAARSTAT